MSIEALTWAMSSTKATLAARLVLFSLADHAHPDGSMAFPSVDTIARQALVDRRTVQRSLRELVEMGEIRVSGKTKAGVTIYAVGGGNLSPDFLSDGSRTVRAADDRPRGDTLPPSPDKLSPLCPQCGVKVKGKTVAEHLADVHLVDVLETASDYAEKTA